jgi:hypothetical protein
MRVCPDCGLGLLLEAPADLAPKPGQPFMVLDTTLAIEAVSARAEQLLEITEQQAVHRPLRDLLEPAGVDSSSQHGLMRAIADAASGSGRTRTVFIRPRKMFGVRIRARIGACGPPRAALIVFDAARPDLRSV